MPKLSRINPVASRKAIGRIVGILRTMPNVDKHRFKQIREKRLRPHWHKFNCQNCGVPVREFSDERVSLFLCQDCLDAKFPHRSKGVIQSEVALDRYDWWDLWVIEYESKEEK